MADDDGTTTPPGEETPPPPAGSSAGDERQQAQLERTRREAADLRRRLSEAETERDKLKESSLSEQERATKRAEQAEAKAAGAAERLRAVSLKAAVGLAAPGLGIVNAKAALRLLDVDAVEFDEEGDAVDASVAKALRATVKEYPFLTRTGSADAGEGDGDRSGSRVGGEEGFARDLNAALRRTRR